MLNDVEVDANIVESSIDFHLDLLLPPAPVAMNRKMTASACLCSFVLAKQQYKKIYLCVIYYHENHHHRNNQELGGVRRIEMIRNLCDVPDVISLLSANAFKLLVGAIRCGNRGEPLTRSRNVGC